MEGTQLSLKTPVLPELSMKIPTESLRLVLNQSVPSTDCCCRLSKFFLIFFYALLQVAFIRCCRPFMCVAAADCFRSFLFVAVGFYCGSTGLNAVTGACDEGYYCPPGQSVSNPTGLECMVGHYCPAQTTYPIEYQFGYFTNTTGQATCTICPAGW